MDDFSPAAANDRSNAQRLHSANNNKHQLELYLSAIPDGGLARERTCSTRGLGGMTRGVCLDKDGTVISVAWSGVKCISAALRSVSRTARSSEIVQIVQAI